MIAEVHRDRKERSQPFSAADIHPFLKAEAEKPRPWGELKKDLRSGG